MIRLLPGVDLRGLTARHNAWIYDENDVMVLIRDTSAEQLQLRENNTLD